MTSIIDFSIFSQLVSSLRLIFPKDSNSVGDSSISSTRRGLIMSPLLAITAIACEICMGGWKAYNLAQCLS